MDNSLDIQRFLSDKKKQKRSVIELMRQKNNQKQDSKSKSRHKSRNKKRPGKSNRKMMRRKR